MAFDCLLNSLGLGAQKLALPLVNELFDSEFHVAQYGSQKARPKYLAGMHWNSSDSPVWVAKEEMAATAPHNFEAKLLKDSNEFLAFEPRKTGHTETCWIPISSS
jgi:hypothetical protein